MYGRPVWDVSTGGGQDGGPGGGGTVRETRGELEAAARCIRAKQTRCRHLADSARCSRVTVVADAAPSHFKITHRSTGTWGQPRPPHPRWCAAARMQTSPHWHQHITSALTSPAMAR